MAIRFWVRLVAGARPVKVTIEDDDGRRLDLALALDEADWLAGAMTAARQRVLRQRRQPAKTGRKGGRA